MKKKQLVVKWTLVVIAAVLLGWGLLTESPLVYSLCGIVCVICICMVWCVRHPSTRYGLYSQEGRTFPECLGDGTLLETFDTLDDALNASRLLYKYCNRHETYFVQNVEGDPL